MPLHQVAEYHAWIARESPTTAAQSVARTFIAEIGDVPWRVPSVPIGELSNQPEFEVRTAILPVAGNAMSRSGTSTTTPPATSTSSPSRIAEG